MGTKQIPSAGSGWRKVCPQSAVILDFSFEVGGEGRDQWGMGTGFGGGGQGSTARFHASYLARAFGRVGVWELAHAARVEQSWAGHELDMT